MRGVRKPRLVRHGPAGPSGDDGVARPQPRDRGRASPLTARTLDWIEGRTIRPLEILLLTLLAVCLLLAACSSTPNPNAPTTTTRPGQQLGWGVAVTEITLQDGTPCAVLYGTEGRGAITCDWQPR